MCAANGEEGLLRWFKLWALATAAMVASTGPPLLLKHFTSIRSDLLFAMSTTGIPSSVLEALSSHFKSLPHSKEYVDIHVYFTAETRPRMERVRQVHISPNTFPPTPKLAILHRAAMRA